MRKLITTALAFVASFGCGQVIAQTGTFSTVNLTGSGSGATILQANAGGTQVIALSNDDITGVDQIKINDAGIGEGLVFSDAANNQIDISVSTQASGGLNAFMFRTISTVPFYFRSPGNASMVIDAIPNTNNTYKAELNLVGTGKITYLNNGSNGSNTSNRLNLTTIRSDNNVLSDVGMHIGPNDTWLDRSLHIRAPNSPLNTSHQEILFQSGGIGSDNPVVNGRIYYEATSDFRTDYLNIEKANMFGVHITTNQIHFGQPVALDQQYETFNFRGAVKASKLLLGEFAAASASRFPTDPAFLLAVDGKMISTEAWCAIKSRWPDYVFEKDYTLPSLEEVSDYVKQNQHLPGIPTASEVKESGVDMGEMHSAMLKKVEELTLYLIDMNERVKSLEQKNKALKHELDGSK